MHPRCAHASSRLIVPTSSDHSATLMPQVKAIFDPIAVLRTLDRHGVMYIIVGALGRVIHGSDELTAGVDVVPAMAAKNLRQLRLALGDLNARSPDGNVPDLEKELRRKPILELRTDAGEVKIVAEPPGTRGYRTLRTRATREALGKGVRPSVASLDDHAIMLVVLDRDRDAEPLRTVRRLIELDYGRHGRRAQRNLQRSHGQR